jgi:hypothetical protein
MESTDGLWQKLLNNKYLKEKTMSRVQIVQGDSWFWHALLEVRDLFYSFCNRKIGNGKRTRFWEDPWRGIKPFAIRFGQLYKICEVTEVTVLTSRLQCLHFRRTLTGETLRLWERLKHESLV